MTEKVTATVRFIDGEAKQWKCAYCCKCFENSAVVKCDFEQRGYWIRTYCSSCYNKVFLRWFKELRNGDYDTLISIERDSDDENDER